MSGTMYRTGQPLQTTHEPRHHDAVRGQAVRLQALRVRDEARYRDALYRHLTGSPDREIEFFVNPARFTLMKHVIGDVLGRDGVSILNVASGPFAFEHYAATETACIQSFDFDARLKALHRDLMSEGLIANCDFEILNIAEFTAGPQFDLVIVNDLFYAPALDFFALFGELAASVAPGGLLYFDIQDRRAEPVWRLFGKGGRTRRYNLSEVRRHLSNAGFDIVTVAPSLGIKGGLDHRLRKLLWVMLGIANNSVFVARRRI